MKQTQASMCRHPGYRYEEENYVLNYVHHRRFYVSFILALYIQSHLSSAGAKAYPS